jgi:hypothetical protein
MTRYQKFGLITGQVFIGLGFGLAGAIVSSILVYIYFELTGMRLDLFGEIMYALIGGYIGIQIGIGFDGFKFLKKIGRRTDFLRFFGQSVVGLISGLVIFFVTVISFGQSVPHVLTNFLAIALPLTASIIGFNWGLTTTEKESG